VTNLTRNICFQQVFHVDLEQIFHVWNKYFKSTNISCRLRIRPCHIFCSTFGGLLPELLIDLIRAHKDAFDFFWSVVTMHWKRFFLERSDQVIFFWRLDVTFFFQNWTSHLVSSHVRFWRKNKINQKIQESSMGSGWLRVARGGYGAKAPPLAVHPCVVEGVCVTFQRCSVFFTWYLTLKNEVFMWNLCDSGYAWDRVRGRVFESIYAFPNMKRNSAFDQDISRHSHPTLCDIPLRTHPLTQNRVVCIYVYVWKRDNKRETEGKREKTRES